MRVRRAHPAGSDRLRRPRSRIASPSRFAETALSRGNPMEQDAMAQDSKDLRRKIARYRRSLAVMNDPETIKMIERVIKETSERIETVESR